MKMVSGKHKWIRIFVKKFKSPDTVMKVRRLEWHGHFITMDGERTLKLLEGKSGGGKEKGRP
jgi:hypothetical protein